MAIGSGLPSSVSDQNILISGNYQTYKNSVTHTGYIFVSLQSPCVSTIFVDSAHWSDVGTSTEWDLYTDMSPAIPKSAQAVLLQMVVKDSAAVLTDGLYFAVGPTATYWYHAAARPPGVVWTELTCPVPCSLDGSDHPTLWYRINASGASTMQIVAMVLGYWI
jgi:hypothetical protein